MSEANNPVRDNPYFRPTKQKIAEELDKIKGMKGRTRWEYIWAYYRISIVVTLAIIAIAAHTLYTQVINPPPRSIMMIAWMGQWEHEESFSIFREALTDYLSEYPERETVTILTFFTGGDPQHDMAMHQRFVAMTAAAEIDIVLGTFIDLYEFDARALGIARDWSFGDIDYYFDEAGIGLPGEPLIGYHVFEDYRPFPFAISLADVPLLNEAGISTDNLYFAVMANTQRVDMVTRTIRRLWG